VKKLEETRKRKKGERENEKKRGKTRKKGKIGKTAAMTSEQKQCEDNDSSHLRCNPGKITKNASNYVHSTY